MIRSLVEGSSSDPGQGEEATAVTFAATDPTGHRLPKGIVVNDGQRTVEDRCNECHLLLSAFEDRFDSVVDHQIRTFIRSGADLESVLLTSIQQPLALLLGGQVADSFFKFGGPFRGIGSQSESPILAILQAVQQGGVLPRFPSRGGRPPSLFNQMSQVWLLRADYVETRVMWLRLIDSPKYAPLVIH
jgi:hypothetical protein